MRATSVFRIRQIPVLRSGLPLREEIGVRAYLFACHPGRVSVAVALVLPKEQLGRFVCRADSDLPYTTLELPSGGFYSRMRPRCVVGVMNQPSTCEVSVGVGDLK